MAPLARDEGSVSIQITKRGLKPDPVRRCEEGLKK